MKRREILKQLSAVPFAGTILAQETLIGSKDSRTISDTLSEGKSIYESIGVDTIINCRGTFTILGGSTERDEVLTAMEAASGYFAQYDELAYGIGDRLAELTGADWGMVSAGCAAGLKHVTAACVTGGNPEKLIRIPDLTGLEKTEVIIPGYSRNVYDHAVRNVGVTVVMVDTPEELKAAINSRTAMIYVNAGRGSLKGAPLSLEVISEIASPRDVPILLDAAAEDLTIPIIHLQRGATIVAYSGGKAICGPQCAGLLLGDKSILLSAWQASSPHHGPGRDNKVGKEEMFGMLAAVEAWTKRDHSGEWKTWLSWLDEISQRLTKIDGVKTEITEPQGLSNHAPVLQVRWDPQQLHITGEELAEEVARNKPRLAIGWGGDDGLTSINITPNQMRPGNSTVVANRLFGILSSQRLPRKLTMQAPSLNISGRWTMEVTFPSSTSKHEIFLSQEGNWLEGTHETDFERLELVGTIEGDKIRMRSDLRKPGDHITYLFSGMASERMLKGSIHLGEYLTAKFQGERTKVKRERKQIFIPGGPPLAT